MDSYTSSALLNFALNISHFSSSSETKLFIISANSDFVTTSFKPSTSEICFSRDIISELILLISILLLAVSMLN